MSITDTIDNAIRDYGLSADAMRWTPEPLPPAPLRLPVVEIRFDADGLTVDADAEQRAGLGGGGAASRLRRATRHDHS